MSDLTTFDSDLILMLLPVVFLQILLMIISVIHILKHPNYKYGNQLIWILIVCLINLIGPLLYFTIGRGEE